MIRMKKYYAFFLFFPKKHFSYDVLNYIKITFFFTSG